MVSATSSSLSSSRPKEEAPIPPPTERPTTKEYSISIDQQLGHPRQAEAATDTGALARNEHITHLNAESPISAFGAEAYHSETRKVSSVVIDSSTVGEEPDTKDRVRYVEVPTIEEQIKYVTVHEKREVEKRVPKYEFEYVDRIVEVPKIVYKDVPNTAKKYVERRIENPVPSVVEKTREVVKEVKVPKPRYVEKVVEVPGEIVEVPKYYDVENKIEVPRHINREVPVVVAQTIKPIITESDRSLAVDVLDYEPEVMPIDIHIAKPIQSALEVVGQREARHRLVNITAGHYNTILKLLNAHMDERTRQCLPFVSDGGRIAFVPDQEAQYIVAPDNVQVEGWNRPRTEVTQVAAREAMSMKSYPAVESQHANRAACCDSRAAKKHTQAHTETQVTARGASSTHHQHSVMQTDTTARLSAHQSGHHDASGSKSHQYSHVQTENSGVFTSTVGDDQILKDGSTTVLSHRPQQKSRVCC